MYKVKRLLNGYAAGDAAVIGAVLIASLALAWGGI